MNYFEEFMKTVEPMHAPVTRGAKQRAIEDSIVRFRPDFVEFHDMLDAFRVALEARYEDGLEEVDECIMWLKESLAEADSTHPVEVDARERERNLQRGSDE